MLIELLTKPAPLWNGVTISTAIGAGIALLLSVLAILLTWGNIPKPYWKDETSYGFASWHPNLVNRGQGTADDVRLSYLVSGTWVEIEQWDTRPHNETLGYGLPHLNPGTKVKLLVTWGAHPFPWFRRRKTFRLTVPPAGRTRSAEELGVF